MEPLTYADRFIEFAWEFGPKLLIATLLLVFGFWIIRKLTALFDSFLKARKVDESLRPFLSSTIDILLKVGLVLVVAGQIGLETTSFIAIFSAVAFSLGFALQGSLGNFAAGILILLQRPYRIGDWVRIEDHLGLVEEINIFNTILTTEHNVRRIVPNGKMIEGMIENMPHDEDVQIEISFLFDSKTSVAELREATLTAEAQNPWRQGKRPPEVVVTDVTRDDMKVDIAWWTKGEHYIKTLDIMAEALRSEFDKRGIQMGHVARREDLS